MSWTGWLKEGNGPWVAVVTGPDWLGTYDLLIHVESCAQSVERTVTPTGRHPDRRRRPR